MKPRSKRTRRCLFECLESRQFLSVVSVSGFGAVANDGKDDTAAILRALRASEAGDTVVFSGGVYDVKGELPALPGNRTYKGENGATLRGKTDEGHLLRVRSDGVTVTGLTLEGGGIFIDKSGGMNENIVLNNNVFRIDTRGEHRSGITFTSGLRNSKITNNYFTGYNSSFGIYGYNYNGLTIANNELVDVNAGMHIDALGRDNGNLLVEQNYLKGMKGMGLEFQSRATNLKFLDNWFEKPNLSSERDRNKNSMAFSLILDKSSDIQIKRNVVIAPERPDGKGCRIGFEVGGDNAIVEDNYVNGINHVLAMNDGEGSASVLARNNKFLNYLEAPRISYKASNRKLDLSNNGPNVQLSWDLNRGRPGRNRRFGGTDVPTDPNPQTIPPAPPVEESPASTPPVVTAPTPRPTPVPKPTPAPKPIPTPQAPVPSPVVLSTPTSLTASAYSYNRVTLSWKDTASGEDGYKIERSFDGVNWISLGTMGPNARLFTDITTSAAQKYYYRVSVFAADADTKSSNVAQVNTPYSMAATSIPYGYAPLPIRSPIFSPVTVQPRGVMW